jgi:hypothetical protein
MYERLRNKIMFINLFFLRIGKRPALLDTCGGSQVLRGRIVWDPPRCRRSVRDVKKQGACPENGQDLFRFVGHSEIIHYQDLR